VICDNRHVAATASPRTQRQSRGDTSGRILDVAEELAQVRGFNGFSYADVASRLEVTSASVHYHFPGKADLGAALVDRYTRRFTEALSALERSRPDAPGRLAGYADLYEQVLRSQRMCLCGMLAAEYKTLPGEMRERVVGFFEQNETWLARVLEAGLAEHALAFAGSPRVTARTLIGGLEGAMMVAHLYGDVDRFRAVASQLIASLVAPPQASARAEA
jgi:TetR/AcrR family transcriptional repressor of nem operon